MKNFLNRLRVNTWSAFEACLNKALCLFDSDKVLGAPDTTRRLVSLSLLVGTVAFWCSTPSFLVGLFNTIRGK